MSITKRMHILVLSALFGIAIVATTISSSHAMSYVWSVPVELSQDASGTQIGLSSHQQMAISSDGQHRVAVWSRIISTIVQLEVSTSHDEGVTWSTPVTISSTTINAQLPQIIVSEDGLSSTVVWRNNAGDNMYQMMASSSTDGGANWGQPQALSSIESGLFRFTLAGSADGSRVTVAWGHNEPGSGRLRVQAISSQDAGSTWGSIADFAPLTFNSSDNNPDVTVSDDGTKVGVAWVNSGLDRNIRYSSSGDGGVTWNGSVTLHSTTDAVEQPISFNASADNSKQTITWTEFSTSTPTNKSVKVISSTDSGALWSSPVTVASGQNLAANPTSMLSGDGDHVAAMWLTDDGASQTTLRVSVSGDIGATWSTPAVIDTAIPVNQIEVSPPRIASSNDGSRITVLWGNSARFSTSIDNGATWSTPAFAVASQAATHQVGVLSTANGVSFVASWWQNTTGGIYRVHTATLNDPTVPQEVTTTLLSSADNHVRSGHSDRNYGSVEYMRLQSSGDNRALLRFDQSEIENAVGTGSLTSAVLRLTIVDNGNNWGTTGRPIGVHRLLMDWAEGDGTESDRGVGIGSTWNCAFDSIIENQSKNCDGATEWTMGQPNNPSVHPWHEAATASYTITNDLAGIIELDVTGDVQAFLNGQEDNFGWLIKRTNEGQNGQVSFGTKESSVSPELVLTYDQ